MTASFVERLGHDESNIKQDHSAAGLATNLAPFIAREHPDVGILGNKGRRNDDEKQRASKQWSRRVVKNQEVGDVDVGILDRRRRGEQ